MTGAVERTVDRLEAPPSSALPVFGDRFDLACHFARLLGTAGVTRGLLGPREPQRLWQRHLLNCAVVTELLPVGARVVDVGSGAGLPGVVLAIRRPDLRVDLVEPLLRRVRFLEEVVAELGLGNAVRVIRGRAEEADVIAGSGSAEWVTARAVAPLDRLVRWCLPLLLRDGHLLALKGASAAVEIRKHQEAISRLGGRDVRLAQCGDGVLATPTAVVIVRRGSGQTARKGHT